MKRKLGRKAIKLRNKLIFLIVVLVLFCAFFFSNNNRNENVVNYSKETQELIKSASAIKDNTEAKTYYVSEEGTSSDGTDINNPMSLKIANTKTFYENEKVLFKCGDTFYGQLNFNFNVSDGGYLYIGSYGKGEKPIISGANILINNNAWVLEDKLYKIDLSNYSNFLGIGETYWEPYNVGFLEDEKGNIYGSRKKSKDSIEKEYDYYCENNYLYIKSSKNPSDKLGKIKFNIRINLISLSSNMIIEGLNIQNTGAHGIVKKNSKIENIYIKDCVIKNVGGSVQALNSFLRYGNGIEIWNQGENILVEKNIFKNIYDAGFTFQGNDVEDGFKNINASQNIFMNCTYSIEIFCRNDKLNDNGIKNGIKNCNIKDNVSINQGNGWGYNVRTDKSVAAEVVLWDLPEGKTQLSIVNNKYFNSLRLSYIWQYNSCKRVYIDSVQNDENYNFINEKTLLINSLGKYDEREILKQYNKEQNSTFRTLSESELNLVSNTSILESDDYDLIKDYYINLEKEFAYTDSKKETLDNYLEFKTSYKSKLSNEELTAIENIENYLKNTTLSNLNESELKEQIDKNYLIGNNLITRYKSKEITDKDLYDMLSELSNIGKTYSNIYKETTSNEDVTNQITETSKLLENNIDLNLQYPEALLIESKSANQSDLTIEKIRATALVNWAKEVTNIYINNHISSNPITHTYSETNLTNKNVKVTLNIGQDSTITNNDGKNEITFTQNGEYIFHITRRGRELTYTVTVNNIDKTSPTISGIENRKIYQEAVTPKITDENLQEVIITFDGEQIPYKENMTLSDAGIYVITAKDKAGNETIMTISIISKENEDYQVTNTEVKNIASETTLETFKEKLNANIDYKIYRQENENQKEITSKDKIATGDILQIDGGSKYTLIVKGDCNKDSVADIMDIIKLRKAIVGEVTFENSEEMAADVNDDNSYDIMDVIRMRKNLVQ